MFKNKKYFFMSAKRPRPAIPVLVHVDNPAEVGSVTVDVSTIEGKMDTVINNQNRIYDKIPTSGGGGGSSADLTTVNEKITAINAAVGDGAVAANEQSLIGLAKGIRASLGSMDASDAKSSSNIKGRLYNIQSSLGDATDSVDAGYYNVKSLLYNLRSSVGNVLDSVSPTNTTVRGLCMNVRDAIGNSTEEPTSSGTSVRDLLTAIKQNTASGGSGGSADLTTVNEKITALAEAIGPINSTYEIGNLLGRAKNISRSVGDYNVPLSINDTDIRSILYNLRTAVGNGSATPTLTGTSVRDLLTQIKENTASGGGGGGGGSADLTTVNEKTTALAAAIGSASDDSSTVSVIGLLKSITDKY